MKVRTKEEMAAYQRKRRSKSNTHVTPTLETDVTPVTPVNVTPDCNTQSEDEWIIGLEDEIESLKKVVLDRELQIKKLTVRVAFLEKSMERYAALDKSQKSSYRLGPEFSRL